MQWSEIDLSITGAPRVTVPRDYNAAADFIDRHIAQGRSQHVAFRDDRTTLTYGALAERVARAGNLLRGLGLAMEQRVALCLLDTIDFPTVFWGAVKAGLVAVPLNTLLTSNDYSYLLHDCRARVLVVSDVMLERLAPAIAASPHLAHVIVARSPAAAPGSSGDERASHRYGTLDALLAQASPLLDAAPTVADDVACWLYTSGSTGRPKAALHLHAHFAFTAALYGHGVLGIRPDDVIYSVAKLFFAYGLGNAMSFPLLVGATAVLMAERPTPASVVRVMQQHRPTIFCGVPTLIAALLADPGCVAANLSPALRVSISAGEALPRHLGEQWRDRFGSDILDGIGTTEMLHMFLSNRPGDVRYGTSGKPVPGYQIKIVDDAGEPVGPGEEGALWVRGPSAAQGYWNDRLSSLATFHGPWTRTGDRYVVDDDGYYTYVGRSDDMLKVGGQWVSPFEVESAIASHPAVLEAAVVGLGDADGLIKPKAFVVLKAPMQPSPALAATLKDHVKAQLAPHKYPRWIEFVAELPKTATGKIQRFKLRTS